jgi:two-component system sensor histidine kinase KdpD
VRFRRRALRLLLALGGVAVVTFVAHKVVPVNATTVGFAYLLLILVIATTWGFFEAAASSVLATLVFNFYFFPPIGTFTIADPQNWVALFSFLATSLIASRLSTTAKARALEAIDRRQDLERLYSFSRAILLIDRAAPFPQQLIEKFVEIFKVDGVVLYDRRSRGSYRAGNSLPQEVEAHLSDVVSLNSSSVEVKGDHVIMGLSLGTEPVASMALRGAIMPEPLLQGIANLVAIGLERARAQHLAQQIEAARQSEKLRTTLIDAMAHEFKTPLTLIKATTTSLLANPNQPSEARRDQLKAADGEAEHLRQLIDDAVEMARLDTARIEVHPEISTLQETLADVIASMQSEVEDHPVSVQCSQQLPQLAFDKRLMKLAIKQLVDNALKYSPAEKEVQIGMHANNGFISMEITDFGHGIPAEEQSQIFERFYRSPSVKDQIPGSGLGLSIAHSIVKAHNGELTVTSRPGRTTFRVTLPILHPEAI